MTITMKTLCLTSLLVLTGSLALAKLPAPSDEAKAKAAEAAAKAAWVGKVDGYKLCLAQDKVVAYLKQVKPVDKAAKPADKPALKDAKVAVATTTCADPGPFVYPPIMAVAPAVPAVAAASSVATVKKP